MKSMSTALATLTYQVLVDHAGASADSDSQWAFVHYFTKPAPGNEYRFQGSLGHGGKFRFPQFKVDSYPEDETPVRLAAIAKTNEQLARMVRQHAPGAPDA